PRHDTQNKKETRGSRSDLRVGRIIGKSRQRACKEQGIRCKLWGPSQLDPPSPKTIPCLHGPQKTKRWDDGEPCLQRESSAYGEGAETGALTHHNTYSRTNDIKQVR
ncbi:unnamed protein product, partial [Ectocarpus fasciculatus]